jgi:hypothetical protein
MHCRIELTLAYIIYIGGGYNSTLLKSCVQPVAHTGTHIYITVQRFFALPWTAVINFLTIYEYLKEYKLTGVGHRSSRDGRGTTLDAGCCVCGLFSRK